MTITLSAYCTAGGRLSAISRPSALQPASGRKAIRHLVVLQRDSDQRRAVLIEPDARVVRAASDEGADPGAQHLVADGNQLLAAVEIVAIEDAHPAAGERVVGCPVAGNAEVRSHGECPLIAGTVSFVLTSI